jgi:hypothetical protein
VALAVPPLAPPAAQQLLPYIPAAIRARLGAGSTGWIAELRRITVLFVNLPGVTHVTPIEEAQRMMHDLQTTIYQYEGSVNKLSVGDEVQLLADVDGTQLSEVALPSRVATYKRKVKEKDFSTLRGNRNYVKNGGFHTGLSASWCRLASTYPTIASSMSIVSSSRCTRSLLPPSTIRVERRSTISCGMALGPARQT